MFFHFPATRYNQNWWINHTENATKLTGNVAKNEINVKKYSFLSPDFTKLTHDATSDFFICDEPRCGQEHMKKL